MALVVCRTRSQVSAQKAGASLGTSFLKMIILTGYAVSVHVLGKPVWNWGITGKPAAFQSSLRDWVVVLCLPTAKAVGYWQSSLRDIFYKTFTAKARFGAEATGYWRSSLRDGLRSFARSTNESSTRPTGFSVVPTGLNWFSHPHPPLKRRAIGDRPSGTGFGHSQQKAGPSLRSGWQGHWRNATHSGWRETITQLCIPLICKERERVGQPGTLPGWCPFMTSAPEGAICPARSGTAEAVPSLWTLRIELAGNSRSFDCATISHRDIVAPLRMTRSLEKRNSLRLTRNNYAVMYPTHSQKARMGEATRPRRL